MCAAGPGRAGPVRGALPRAQRGWRRQRSGATCPTRPASKVLPSFLPSGPSPRPRSSASFSPPLLCSLRATLSPEVTPVTERSGSCRTASRSPAGDGSASGCARQPRGSGDRVGCGWKRSPAERPARRLRHAVHTGVLRRPDGDLRSREVSPQRCGSAQLPPLTEEPQRWRRTLEEPELERRNPGEPL